MKLSRKAAAAVLAAALTLSLCVISALPGGLRQPTPDTGLSCIKEKQDKQKAAKV